jgi:hypothetical protein
MRVLDEFFKQELHGWLRVGAGYFAGARGVFSLGLTLFAARAYILNFSIYDLSVRILAGLFLLITAVVS